MVVVLLLGCKQVLAPQKQHGNILYIRPAFFPRVFSVLFGKFTVFFVLCFFALFFAVCLRCCFGRCCEFFLAFPPAIPVVYAFYM